MLKDVEICWKMSKELNAGKYANFDCFGDKQTWWHMVTLPRRLVARILLLYPRREDLGVLPCKGTGKHVSDTVSDSTHDCYQSAIDLGTLAALKAMRSTQRDWVWHFLGRQSWVALEGPQPWSSWVSLGNSRRGLKIADSWHLITHADVSPQIWNLPSCMTSTTWYNVIDLTWYNMF